MNRLHCKIRLNFISISEQRCEHRSRTCEAMNNGPTSRVPTSTIEGLQRYVAAECTGEQFQVISSKTQSGSRHFNYNNAAQRWEWEVLTTDEKLYIGVTTNSKLALEGGLLSPNCRHAVVSKIGLRIQQQLLCCSYGCSAGCANTASLGPACVPAEHLPALESPLQ